MISSSIIKLIDEAILPASVLILAKLLGFFLVSFIGQIPVSIKYRDLLGVLPSIQFENASQYTLAENYSNIVMFTAVALGSLFVLVRAHYFHESHIHPNLQSRLASLNLETLIATATWFSYTMFTFLQPPPSAGPQVLVLFGDFLPRTFLASKWLMASVPFVIYGVMRYLYVIHEKKEGESPERVLISDVPLLTTVLLWIIIVFVVIYGGQFLPDGFLGILE